ncbi:unnamed protein product [Cochlearia groenlandica]
MPMVLWCLLRPRPLQLFILVRRSVEISPISLTSSDGDSILTFSGRRILEYDKIPSFALQHFERGFLIRGKVEEGVEMAYEMIELRCRFSEATCEIL